MSATNPVFFYLFGQYKALHEQGLDDTEAGRLLFIEMMAYAPPEYLAVAHQIADELALVPEPDGYLDDGTPMISLSAMARHHGMSEAEATENIERFMADRESLGLSNDGIVTDAALIHRKQ